MDVAQTPTGFIRADNVDALEAAAEQADQLAREDFMLVAALDAAILDDEALTGRVWKTLGALHIPVSLCWPVSLIRSTTTPKGASSNSCVRRGKRQRRHRAVRLQRCRLALPRRIHWGNRERWNHAPCHWEVAASPSRQLFELLVNMEYLMRRPDRKLELCAVLPNAPTPDPEKQLEWTTALMNDVRARGQAA